VIAERLWGLLCIDCLLKVLSIDYATNRLTVLPTGLESARTFPFGVICRYGVSSIRRHARAGRRLPANPEITKESESDRAVGSRTPHSEPDYTKREWFERTLDLFGKTVSRFVA